MIRIRLALAWFATSMATASTAAVVQQTPLKDNTLIQNIDPATQFSNGQGDLFSGRTNQDGQNPPTISIRRGLLAFDVAGSIPVGSTIEDATLTMRETTGQNGDRLVTLHLAQQNWGEGLSSQNNAQGAPAQQNDATWLYRFYDAAAPASSPAWGTPGGDFQSAASGSALVSDDLGAGQSFTWIGAGMTADVQSWLDNPAANFGWTIVGVESSGQTAKRFNSGETAFPPLLTVTYSIPEPGAGLLMAFGGLGLLAAWRKSR